MKRRLSLLVFICIFIFSSSASAQFYFPGGEDCETAVPIPIGADYYGDEYGPGSAEWYHFIAPCDGSLMVPNVGVYGSERRIYSGTCGDLTLAALDGGPWDMLAGEEVYIEVQDTWAGVSSFDIDFDTCEVDSMLLDIQGSVYYDLNNNGIKDLGEMGKFLTPILSDPAGIYTFSGVEGHYYSPVSDLPDGIYEIAPTLEDYWSISTDSLVYTIIVDPDFEQRDSLDFGLHPDTLFYDITADITNSAHKCNDTIYYWLDVQNTGTILPSGIMHIELDDSLYYVNADVAPDSIVGQNVYWSYTDLFFGYTEGIVLELGTPDGFEDTVTSYFNVTIDTAGVEVLSVTDTLTRPINCAYDPNDKTPTPAGFGDMGNIPPTTERIEYLIRFQNTGTDTATNVVIEDQLDENLNWGTLNILSTSHFMELEMDDGGNVSFIFNNIFLPDSNVNMPGSQGFVKYEIELDEGLPIGTSIYNTAEIYFDLNPAIVTNTTVNTLWVDDAGLNDNSIDQTLRVYPNPFTDQTTVYFDQDLSNYQIEVVDLLGNRVYENRQMNGNQQMIDGKFLNKGVYLLLLTDKHSGEIISTRKIVLN